MLASVNLVVALPSSRHPFAQSSWDQLRVAPNATFAPPSALEIKLCPQIANCMLEDGKPISQKLYSVGGYSNATGDQDRVSKRTTKQTLHYLASDELSSYPQVGDIATQFFSGYDLQWVNIIQPPFLLILKLSPYSLSDFSLFFTSQKRFREPEFPRFSCFNQGGSSLLPWRTLFAIDVYCHWTQTNGGPRCILRLNDQMDLWRSRPRECPFSWISWTDLREPSDWNRSDDPWIRWKRSLLWPYNKRFSPMVSRKENNS